MNKPRINFIERNKLNAAKAKTKTLSKSASVDETKKLDEVKNKPAIDKPVNMVASTKDSSVKKFSNSSKPLKPRPSTAPTVRSRPVDETDLVTNLIKRNIHEVLFKIFFIQDNMTLTACRRVNKAWYRYFKQVFWRENRVLSELGSRLSDNWRSRIFHKVRI